MLNRSLIYLFINILVVLFAKYIQQILSYINTFYHWVAIKLMPIFQQIGLGKPLEKIVLLVVIPIAITGVIALIYRLIKGQDMPHFIAITWCLWLVIVLSNLLIH